MTECEHRHLWQIVSYYLSILVQSLKKTMRQDSIPDNWAEIRIRYLPKAGVLTALPECVLEEVEFDCVAGHAKILVCIPSNTRNI
jgi:hypothetical protein